MAIVKLFYATNRKHEGKDRWNPTGYGSKFSDDGIENLRFGRLSFEADADKIKQCVAKKVDHGIGDGKQLSQVIARAMNNGMTIRPYREKIPTQPSAKPTAVKLGSKAIFSDLHTVMTNTTDVVIFVHGFNVSWTDAVASAASLQLLLNAIPSPNSTQAVQVVLLVGRLTDRRFPMSPTSLIALKRRARDQVDCSDIVDDTYDEHGYFAWGMTAADIRLSIEGEPADSPARARRHSRELPNVWRLEAQKAP